MNWKQYFIDLTLVVASKSKDPSRQVGCVIVGPDKEIRSTGFNGFPRGVRETSLMDHGVVEMERMITSGDVKYQCQCGKVITQYMDEYMDNQIPKHFGKGKDVVLSNRWERPIKYQYVEHAERNAIYNAARVGTPLLGCSAFVSLAPCVGCARALVQAGIVEVYGPAFDHSKDDDYHFDIAEIVLREGGINYVVVDYANKDTA